MAPLKNYNSQNRARCGAKAVYTPHASLSGSSGAASSLSAHWAAAGARTIPCALEVRAEAARLLATRALGRGKGARAARPRLVAGGAARRLHGQEESHGAGRRPGKSVVVVALLG